MKILITGSSGFIGSALLCLDFKYDFRMVRRKGIDDKCKEMFFVDSINGDTDWSNAFLDVDVVIHLAGLAHSSRHTDADYLSVNTEGTLHLANEATKAGVKRFVFISSIGVNGTSTQKAPFCNHGTVNPLNTYSQSKYDAEVGLLKIAEDTGLEVVIIRPTLVYGANAPGNFGKLTKLVNKLPLLPFGLTDNKRDFIAVQNLADLLLTCASHPYAAGHIFLASDDETVSIKEFTNAIAKGLNKSIIQLPIPVSLMRFTGRLMGKSEIVEQLLGNLQVDSSNVQEVLGWVPPYTMEQAMASLSESKK